jgi:23S rRNA pseudouridine2604 synthase
MADISVNKYIAETGFCSRRDADKYIEQCRVTINDSIALKGNRVKQGDVVLVDGEPITKKRKNLVPVYIAMNKPKGITCTTDSKDKTNIIDFIKYKSRIFPIGRLDKRSEGLIFLTNDGDIVNKILRAGNNHEKEYVVTVDKPLKLEDIKTMRSGMKILGVKTKPCYVQIKAPNTFTIILTQGLNRQIRRMCEALGYTVTSLKRVRIMHISIKGIPQGTWRYFSKTELAEMNLLLRNSSNAEIDNIENMDE